MKTREHQLIKILACILIVVSVDLVCVKAANSKPVAHTPERAFTVKVRKASVGSDWGPILNSYTGGSYGIGHVNEMWPLAPHGSRRRTVLGAAIHHHVPFRLLLGIWGAESGFGRYACYFGLTGYFPGTGTSGSFWKDAHLAADLLDRAYRMRYGHRAL